MGKTIVKNAGALMASQLVTWSALGTGLYNSVYAFAIDASGNVYAGGMFINAGGNSTGDHIAKWNGSSWTALGSGLQYDVLALTDAGSGNLYAGGSFVSTGDRGTTLNHFGKWNGSAWSVP